MSALNAPGRASRGFTLIEMIGVLAIMAVLAAAIVPDMIKRLDISYADAEKKNLRNLGVDLEQFILKNRRVPAASGGVNPLNPVTGLAGTWSDAVASQSSLSPLNIQQNEKGNVRGYYIDPQFLVANPAAAALPAFPGYDQNVAGVGVGLNADGLPVAVPNSPRIMLVSNLASPAAVPLPAALSAAQFDAVWSQPQLLNAAAPLPVIVEGDTMLIQRINLSYMFNRVLLTNNIVAAPQMNIEGRIAPIVVPSAVLPATPGSYQSFLLLGTRISLYHPPVPPGVLGLLNYEFIVSGSAGYLYGQITAAGPGGVPPATNAWGFN